ncbi:MULTISPECIES: hypothetical protein [Kitasatospora]|uniref:Uncharacterized protein n=1 Tax=Kitasatospora cathayae TaxID=3004092 RepID=A0ABY7Q7N4_9ACTN|nr:hypothetical protein [Kitasatospora sp. HUAS 3-15]WBP88685.1 hypothetical protein O1G21_24505 [Kitasatospora sp. HUAS 3-15]
MNRIVRNALVTVVTAGALTAAVAPVAMATEQTRSVAGVQAQINNPKTVKAAAYNQARSILAQAGSQTAAKSHPAHGTSDVPVSYGTSLLAAARDEFRAADRNLPAAQKKSDMSIPHYNAIHSAANTMGIDRW